MKHLYLIAALTLITVSAFSQNFYINTAKKSGDWSNTSNWQATLRSDGKNIDTYIIPANIVISIDKNITLGVVEVEISGMLEFRVDKTFSLANGSKITLKGGTIDIDADSKNEKKKLDNKKKEQIIIGGVVKYDGAVEDALTGNLFSNQSTGISPFGFSSSATLPVNFVSFNASKVNDGLIAISWSTSDETNNDHFEIQRSVDGINWSEIAIMFPDTNPSNFHLYKYNDKFSTKGAVYYRIRQVDFDGKEKYSAVKLIGGANSALETNIYVSAKNTVTVDLKNSTENNVMVRLISMNGVTVSQKSNNQSGNKISLTAYNAAPGAYIVQITNLKGMVSAKKILL